MHYLEKQAARTLSPGAGVRPRLPARFEHDGGETAFEPVFVERVARPDAGSDVERASTPVRGADQRAVIVESVLRREPERIETVRERVVPRIEPPRAPREFVARPEPFATVPPPAVQRPTETKRDSQTFPRREDPQPQAPVPVTPRLPDERVVRMIERHERTIAGSREDAPAVVQPRIAPVAASPAEAAMAAPPLRAERTPAQRRPRADEAPPAIHVTIGRIDVRAVITPDAPARPAPALSQPSLSLDDYLKQREGRSR